MKTLILISLVITLLSCKKELSPVSDQADLSSSASIKERSSYFFNIDEVQFNPCTNEEMHITGIVAITLTWTFRDDIVKSTTNAQYRGLKAEGLTTGMKYEGTGHVASVERDGINEETGAAEILNYNVTNKAIFTAPGSGNNLVFTLHYHTSTSANGKVNEKYFIDGYCQ